MSGRDHLQPQLFDDEEYYLPAPTGTHVKEWSSKRERGTRGYTSAHDMPGEWVPNLLPEPTPSSKRWEFGETSDEFIPLTQVVSTQKYVNEHAVQHQLENADPMRLGEDPEVATISDPAEYGVIDGNHRLNAALRRGMLFHPAKVHRRSQPWGSQ